MESSSEGLTTSPRLATKKVVCRWYGNTAIPPALRVQDCGSYGSTLSTLPQTVLRAAEELDFYESGNPSVSHLAAGIAKRLRGRKPAEWYLAAVLSFLLVWATIASAFVVSFTTPTVGLDPRGLAYLAFGVFSSVSWIVQVGEMRYRWILLGSHVSNVLAVLSFVMVVVLQVRFTSEVVAFKRYSLLAKS